MTSSSSSIEIKFWKRKKKEIRRRNEKDGGEREKKIWELRVEESQRMCALTLSHAWKEELW